MKHMKTCSILHIIGDKWYASECPWHRDAQPRRSINDTGMPGQAAQSGRELSIMLLINHLAPPTFDAQMHIMEFSKYWAREDYIFVTVAKWHAAKCPWHRNAQAGCSIREGKLSIMLLITHPAHPAPSDYLRRGTGSNEHWPNIPKSGPVSRSLSLYVFFRRNI